MIPISIFIKLCMHFLKQCKDFRTSLCRILILWNSKLRCLLEPSLWKWVSWFLVNYSPPLIFAVIWDLTSSTSNKLSSYETRQPYQVNFLFDFYFSISSSGSSTTKSSRPSPAIELNTVFIELYLYLYIFIFCQHHYHSDRTNAGKIIFHDEFKVAFFSFKDCYGNNFPTIKLRCWLSTIFKWTIPWCRGWIRSTVLGGKNRNLMFWYSRRCDWALINTFRVDFRFKTNISVAINASFFNTNDFGGYLFVFNPLIARGLRAILIINGFMK